MTVEEHVRTALEHRFEGAAIKVGRFHGSQRVSGEIVWSGFEGQDPLVRQEAVHKAIRKELGSEAQAVSIILAYTPDEIKRMESI